MKCTELLHLQQEFLRSLHSTPSPWLLERIQPAAGFADAREVLDLYLQRAVARTVDPLHEVFPSVQWLIGRRAFDALMQRFYASSPGEPLSAQVLATEFAGFLGGISEADLAPLEPESAHAADGIDLSQALVAAALLDWRCLWVRLAPARPGQVSSTRLLRELQHRSHLWARPRLDRGTRLCDSGVDLEEFRRLVETGAPRRPLPLTEQGTAAFLIHAGPTHEVVVRRLQADEARLLDHCDGTHTIASLQHEASFHGRSAAETLALVHRLIEEGVIVELQRSLDTEQE